MSNKSIRKKAVRSGAVGMAVMMSVMLMLSGCSDAKKEATGTTATPDSTASGKPEKKKLSLRWNVIAPQNATLPSADKDFVKKAIEEKFNVELKMEYLSNPNYQDQLNLKLASGDAPDFFLSGGLDSQKLVLDGVGADMASYVTAAKMPNYFKFWTSEKEVKGYQVHDRFARAPMPFVRKPVDSYYVRKDWLDKLNLKMPETYDDMLNVMRKFRNDDPDGNGKKDTYGFSASGNGTGLPSSMPPFKKYNVLPGFTIDNGKLQVETMSPRLGDIITEVRALTDEGIFDPDWFLNKGTQDWDKAAQGKVGMIYSWDITFALEGIPTSYQNKTKALEPKADWRPFHPLAKTGTGAESIAADAFLFNSGTAKNNPDKVERTIEILDWLASEEGYLLTHYGKEGTHYTRKGKDIQLNASAIQKDITDQGNFLRIYGFFTPADSPEVLGLNEINPNLTDRDREIIKTVKAYKVLQSIGTNVAPPAGFVLADYSSRRRELTTKLLFEEKDASNWPKYREELLTKYKGRDLFKAYAEQISKALGTTITYAD